MYIVVYIDVYITRFFHKVITHLRFLGCTTKKDPQVVMKSSMDELKGNFTPKTMVLKPKYWDVL